jgi:DMSO/TMAO reductase YedYZ molybdopterin-dependent catalytic subunit
MNSPRLIRKTPKPRIKTSKAWSIGRSPKAHYFAFQLISSRSLDGLDLQALERTGPSASGARTPHHLVNGTITPNGLHFVVVYGGVPDIDPGKHRLVIHGLVKRPLVFTLGALARYPMVTRVTFLECGANSAPLFSPQPLQANVQALHGLTSCAEWPGVKLSTLLEEAGVARRPNGSSPKAPTHLI